MRNYCLRRVYQTRKCTLPDADPGLWAGLTQTVGPATIEAGVNMVPKPDLPLPVGGERTIIRGQDNVMTMALHRTLDGTGLTGPITEILCWVEDVGAVDDHLRTYCRNSIDLFAVSLGAAVSRQLVAIEVGEDEWTRGSDGNWRCHVERPLSLIEDLRPSVNEIRERTLAWITGRKLNPRIIEGGALAWLLRAWRERDVLSQFLALFIPLEMVLEGQSTPGSVSPADVQRIMESVTLHCGDDAERLRRLVGAAIQRLGPSLADRFEAMATALLPQTAATDVSAFRKFNRMRNELVHRGKSDVKIVVTVNRSDVIELQGLAERYVFANLFKDDQGVGRPR